MTSQRMFIGRERELKELRNLSKKKSASFIVLKGRRRIGKSTLLDVFSQSMQRIKITGFPPHQTTTKQSEIDEFMKQLSLCTDIPELKADDWTKALLMLATAAKQGKVVIILDEISWIATQDSSFLGKLKTVWDDHLQKNRDLMLIVCGSVSTWIDEHIVNSTAFYGRVTWNMTLDPLPLKHCNQLLEANGFRGSPYEKFKLLSVTGGIPWYIELMQGNCNANANIQNQCFSKEGALFQEFERIFQDIFGRNDQTYKNIVSVLSKSPLTYQQITDQSGYKSSGRLTAYLNCLEKAGFITRDYTWSLNSGKEGRISYYRLSDNYLRFYLHYIEPQKNRIERGQYKDTSLTSLPNWETIMGLQFENLVLSNRRALQDHLNIRSEDIIADNPYTQRKSKTQDGCQIDYLIHTKYQTLYVCEIKFSKNLIDKTVAEDVKQKIAKLTLPKRISVIPILIHVNGICESLKQEDFFYEIIDFSEFL